MLPTGLDGGLQDLNAAVGYDFTETMEPPPELLMALLPYQKQFLAWAVRQVRARWLALPRCACLPCSCLQSALAALHRGCSCCIWCPSLSAAHLKRSPLLMLHCFIECLWTARAGHHLL
jgi:hypothetical protein